MAPPHPLLNLVRCSQSASFRTEDYTVWAVANLGRETDWVGSLLWTQPPSRETHNHSGAAAEYHSRSANTAGPSSASTSSATERSAEKASSREKPAAPVAERSTARESKLAAAAATVAAAAV